jgi:Alginate lyase
VNRKVWSFVILALLAATVAAAQAPAAPRTYEIDGQWLLQAKTQPAIVKAARAEADSAMHAGPFSVTVKSQLPPSGDKHDYMSLARYFWPNPNTANHLPYVQRDGQSNPQINSIPDHTDLFKMEDAVHALALGYELTGHEEYAARATLLIRAWFLDPATHMNPNLRFAQAVLGVNDGRGTGILDARGLPDVTDAIAMLQDSKSWTSADEAGMKSWFSQYYTWLTTSKNGGDEAAAKNNHGSWDDFQTVGIALYLGKQDDARAIITTAQTKRVALQIQPDGKQPLELRRTKAFSYSVFNLEALTRLADFGNRIGVDLWKYRSPDGGSIRAALDYLVPFALNDQHWSYQEIEGFDGDSLRTLLLRSAVQLHEPSYLAAADRLKGKETAEVLILRSHTQSLAPSAKAK